MIAREPEERSDMRIPAWNWRDLVTFVALIGSGLAWGLKLEGRIDRVEAEHSESMRNLERRVTANEAAIGIGVLPRTDERLRALERDAVALRDELQDHIKDEQRRR